VTLILVGKSDFSLAMADSTPIQRIQFGDEISQVKSTKNVYTSAHKHPSLDEKAGAVDFEERAIQIADADLNKKKKQARYYRSSYPLFGIDSIHFTAAFCKGVLSYSHC
jgi:hypothetical protein